MLTWLLAAFIVVPIAEIAIFVEVGSQWGVWPAIGAIFATAVVGSILIHHQGVAVLRRARDEMGAGRFPARQVFDGLCLLIAGTLLLLPGFITDAAGFILLVPVIRHFVMSSLTSHIEIHTSGMSDATIHPDGETINGEFADITDHPSPTSESDPQLPPGR